MEDQLIWMKIRLNKKEEIKGKVAVFHKFIQSQVNYKIQIQKNFRHSTSKEPKKKAMEKEGKNQDR